MKLIQSEVVLNKMYKDSRFVYDTKYDVKEPSLEGQKLETKVTNNSATEFEQKFI